MSASRPSEQQIRIGAAALMLVLCSIGACALARRSHDVVMRAPGEALPHVPVLVARPEDARVFVHAQGTVVPRRETRLVSELAGRVVAVSPSLAVGGFFEAGEVLVRLDPRDYALAVSKAEATLARSVNDATLAGARMRRLEALARHGVESSVHLEEASGAELVAKAAQREAELTLEGARRDLSRTRLVAPFAGRVREKNVDVGQYLTPGTTAAVLYAVDYAEVRLPIPDSELAFLDLPLDLRSQQDAIDGPAVTLHADFAGEPRTWQGRIVRMEGEIDPRSRMVTVVARVEDPYGRQQDTDAVPLALGLFVDAKITGRTLEDVVELPRSALRGRDGVFVVDGEDRLRLRNVDVLRRQRNSILVGDGLASGDRVSLASLEVAVEGMRVLPESRK